MRKARLLWIISVFILLPGSNPVFSQEAKQDVKKAAVASQEETLYQNDMKSIGVITPTRVVIGNPAVADIISVTTKEIVVAGKGAGTTNLIWWDERGEHHVRLKVFVEDMADTKARIDNLLKDLKLPNVYTRTADSEGKVLLLGSVKTSEDKDKIKTALGGLYPRTTNLIAVEEEKALIELEVEVVEVDKGSTKDLGMDWLASGGAVSMLEPSRWSKLGDIPNSLFRVNEWTHDQLTATLNLLVKENKAKILSRPKLACQSGKEAELLVGGEKPVMTTQVSGTSGASSNSVEYKEYGIKLKMSPSLNADGKIKLLLNVEVSDIGEAEILGNTTAPTAMAYPLTKRSTSTQLYLNNGQTLAISGLIKKKTEEELKKFPWLGDIPVLGVFFRNRNTKTGGGTDERSDTELVIMVTPTIVGGDKKNDNQMIQGEKPAKAGTVPDEKKKDNSSGQTQITQVPADKTSAAVTGENKALSKKDAAVLEKKKKKETQAAKKQTKAGEVVSQEKNKTGVAPQSKLQAANKTGAQKIKTPVTVKRDGKSEVKSARVSQQQTEPGISEQPGIVEPLTVSDDPFDAYTRNVIEYLRSNIVYPWAAKQAELQGTVILNLHLANTGELLEVVTAKSSGFSVLDENSLRISRQITPYPAFPKEVTDQDIWIQIPVVYNLKEKK